MRPRFAYQHCKSAPLHLKVQPSAADFILRQYGWRYVLLPLNLFFQNSPINWAVINGNGKPKERWRRIRKVKGCPAPQSEANIQRLALLLTHLSTLPLSRFSLGAGIMIRSHLPTMLSTGSLMEATTCSMSAASGPATERTFFFFFFVTSFVKES